MTNYGPPPLSEITLRLRAQLGRGTFTFAPPGSPESIPFTMGPLTGQAQLRGGPDIAVRGGEVPESTFEIMLVLDGQPTAYDLLDAFGVVKKIKP